MPFWYWAAVTFIFGTIVGSFLNVCIWRMPNEQSIINPPSHCPKCNERLRMIDLVPLFSFLLLGRKCRYCGAPIGWRYFTVEMIMGLLAVALFWQYRADMVDFFAFGLFGAALIAAFFIDLDHWIIPDQVSIFGIALGIGRDVARLSVYGSERALYHIPVPFTETIVPVPPSIIGILACGGLFYLIAVVGTALFARKVGDESDKADKPVRNNKKGTKRSTKRRWTISPSVARLTLAILLMALYAFSVVRGIPGLMGLAVALYLMVEVVIQAVSPREAGAGSEEPVVVASAKEIGVDEAMGGGDIKLAAAIGAVLGLSLAMLSFFLAVSVGSVLGIALAIATGRKVRGLALSFGPMMVIGVFGALFYGRQIIDWYLSYLRH